jgi:CHAD domain-containing protein
MAYQLKRRRPLAKELSRIVIKEFDHALEQIRQDRRRGEAVHEARKSVKKIRAVLRLLQKNLGKAYRVENQRLRTVAHQLSALRDMDALAETMKAVRDHHPRSVTPPVFAAISRGLAGRTRGALSHLHPDRLLARVAGELRQSSTSTARQIRRVSTGSVQRGIARAYLRARKAMIRVTNSPEDLRFHAWRRRVKDHWYHMRLVERFHPTAHARVRRLKRLETWLGDDHNLVLLRRTILTAPARFGGERANALVLGSIDIYQATLRKRALTLGDQLFAHRPKVFGKSVGAWLHGRRVPS